MYFNIDFRTVLKNNNVEGIIIQMKSNFQRKNIFRNFYASIISDIPTYNII